MQVLRRVTLRLGPPFVILVVVFVTRRRLLSLERPSRAALQTRQDHVGEVLLETLEVLSEKAETTFHQSSIPTKAAQPATENNLITSRKQ